jgi:hypothetical protein
MNDFAPRRSKFSDAYRDNAELEDDMELSDSAQDEDTGLENL